MNMPQTIKATCSKCGKVHEVEARKRINVADDPSLKDKVRDGSLFVWDHNPEGEKLYEKCGFATVRAAEGGKYMRKAL